MAKRKSILVLDLGSSSGRAFVFSLPNFEIIGSARFEINHIQSDNGISELNPDEFFNNILRSLRDAIDAAGTNAENILCLGVSVQRATFITFDKVTGKPFHQLVTWKDYRGDEIVKSFNKSLILKAVNLSATVLHWITRSNKFKQASKFRLENNFVTPRLNHIIRNNRKLKEAMRSGRAVFGTVDVWLLHKLKNVNGMEKFEPITDVTNASATGLFDSFAYQYVPIYLKYFKIKESMLPMVVDNSHDFGYTHKSLLGAPVKIATFIADQPASLIGNACFRNMDAKITLGTGAFLNITTGSKCKGSSNGANPMVGWDVSSRKGKTSRVFYTERGFKESATLIRFAKTVGLCADVQQLSDLAFAVGDCDGVFFVPKFDSMAGFINYKNSTTKEHLVRAVLEAVVFSVASFYFLTKEETSYHFDKIRIDGGISANDFICQQLADLINIKIERSIHSSELTSHGVAYLSSYLCGEVLDELEHAAKLYKVDKVFLPNEANRKELFMRYKRFEEICKKFDDIKL